MHLMPTLISNNEELINFAYNNSYVALYPELFLIIVLSSLIAFLVILDYSYPLSQNIH